MRTTHSCIFAVYIAASLLALATAFSGGARKVKFGEHSAVVYIGGCTGTLISPGVVLTAQHCIDGRSDRHIIKKKKVTFPALSNGKKGYQVGVTRVERHDEDYYKYLLGYNPNNFFPLFPPPHSNTL